MNNTYTFNINPVPAPRMTQADKWQKRPAITKYFAFRDEMKYLAYIKHIETLPGKIDSIVFNIPMPCSWAKKKRAEMNGTPHTTRPDLDNYLKALNDCFGEDSHIHTIGTIKKVWSSTGSIQITLNSDNQSHTAQGKFFVDQSLY